MSYKMGKTSSLGGKHNVSHASGKKANSTGARVTASAGKSSGTARGGDKDGCKPMKGC